MVIPICFRQCDPVEFACALKEKEKTRKGRVSENPKRRVGCSRYPRGDQPSGVLCVHPSMSCHGEPFGGTYFSAKVAQGANVGVERPAVSSPSPHYPQGRRASTRTK